MKKTLLFLFTALCCIGLVGCDKKNTQTFQAQEQETTVSQETMTTMEEPIDALMCNMLENGTAYDPSDPDFFWSSLYYFLGSYGEENTLVTKTEDSALKVPKKVAQEYAIALFANYDNLLPLPETLAEYIRYDKDWDAYLLTPAESPLMETVLSDFKKTENGYTLTAKLVSTQEDKEVFGECTVTMQKNAFADGIVNPRYFYSVAEMTVVSGFAPQVKTTTAAFIGLSDGHTVEATLKDGTMQAFQFYEAPVAEQLQALKEGDSFTFGYINDKETGTLTIMNIE